MLRVGKVRFSWFLWAYKGAILIIKRWLEKIVIRKKPEHIQKIAEGTERVLRRLET